MSNGFEALAPLADKLKTQARKQEAEREAKQKASEHIARETNVFLDVMNQTGVKAMAGVRIKPRIEEKDIDFAAAMSKAGVKPLGDDTRAQHRKVRRPIPVQTIADNKRVLEESMSDDLDSIEFLESEDGKSFRRPGIGPDVPRDLRRGRWSVRAQIDLHGMTVDDARCAVAEFLKNARKQELFCVRIIHGKGNGTPGRIGVLREVVRRWLKQRDEVVAFCEPRELTGEPVQPSCVCGRCLAAPMVTKAKQIAQIRRSKRLAVCQLQLSLVKISRCARNDSGATIQRHRKG